MVSFLFVAPPQQTGQNVESCRLDTCPLNQHAHSLTPKSKHILIVVLLLGMNLCTPFEIEAKPVFQEKWLMLQSFRFDLRTGQCSSTVQVRLLRYWEARYARLGGELMGVDMLLSF
ncbi:hypothetical protein IGI04_025762 [Brassica rapa subsp. trilocularis]|uniref:Uncharacterized protein n=1 Tax=Brassica rapa subsp. trilocularis TaxID=1813537 RepID=A0ABQ7KWS8_BRACM|nr:hypothetical protein IGI04_025762 [Brassica rapa subsp. trilocularis]